jgi:hypothetical protein
MFITENWIVKPKKDYRRLLIFHRSIEINNKATLSLINLRRNELWGFKDTEI